ncbi:hypothetical protein ABZP36_014731 [Zizania latifolia]
MHHTAKPINKQSINSALVSVRILRPGLAEMKVYVLLFTVFFFSGLMQLSMVQGVAATAARVIDAKAVDQAIACLLMLAALFVTYLAH